MSERQRQDSQLVINADPCEHRQHGRRLRRLVLVVLLVHSLALRSFAEPACQWNQFRGPEGDGQIGARDVPLKWSETSNVIWKTPIAGKGWSSPVVCDDRVWMTTATVDGKQMLVVCVDLETGQIVHHVQVLENESPRYCHPTNSYASPTPVIEPGRIYVHFGSYGTFCLDTESAEILWKRTDLQCDHWRGPGSSPILHNNKLFVAYDGYDQQYFVAFDKETGQTVWKRDRKIDYGSDNGDHKKAYATAQIIQTDGQFQLIAPSAAQTIAYDPESGEELWRVRHGGMNAATRPVFAHGFVYLTNGDSVGRIKPSLLAVRPQIGLASPDERIVWQFDSAAPRRPSPVVVKDLMFAVSDDGIATCLEAATGEMIWRERIGGNFRASPIAVGDRIYCSNLDGETTVFTAAREYRELATNQLADGFQASPAVVGDRLLLRTTKHLYLIGR